MRKRDLDALYRTLDWYENRKGKRIALGAVSRNLLPVRGWCFFFENGEYRQNMSIPRIVRVESHCAPGDKKSVYNQILKHRGNIAGAYIGGGNHRLSFLRKHIGTAIMNKLARSCETWEEDKAKASIRRAEHWLETMVSSATSSMEVLVVPIEDIEDMDRTAKYIEQNMIALLSNFNENPVDHSSFDWLGNFCSNALVRGSGLWNSNGVMLQYDHNSLNVFQRLVKASG